MTAITRRHAIGRSFPLLLIVVLAAALECRGSGRLKVLTSFLPLYCFAANVASGAAEVENLLPAAAEPHDYQLTVRDRQRIASANLVVLNGLGIDSWIEPMLRLRSSHLPAVFASGGLSTELIPIDGKRPNPHIWLDPILALHSVSNIARALVTADPANEGEYSRNLNDYIARLRKLDGDLREGLAPYQGAKIVTFHDSFRYFARRYDLVVAGVIEEVADVSPSPQTLARLYKVVRETKPKAIFTEPQFSPRLARQIGADLRIPVASLQTLETGRLKPSAYEELMRENLRVLQETLK